MELAWKIFTSPFEVRVAMLVSLLNLCLNGLYGEIAYSTAFNLSLISIWSVGLNYKGKTIIRELPTEKSLLFQKRDGSLSVKSKLIFNF
jgi:hypothetical protein